jgi:hypothetical protein
MTNELPDIEGISPPPGDDLRERPLPGPSVQHEALREGPESLPPHLDLEPNREPGRDEPPALHDEAGLGRVLQTAGLTRTPPLPALRQSAPLRAVLESLGPDLVAAQCAAINRFNRIADRAEDEDNKILELLATKASATYQHKLIELVVGRTVNLNASIKSQRDLPKLEKLTPEKRAQLENLVNEMTDVVDGEIIEHDE